MITRAMPALPRRRESPAAEVSLRVHAHGTSVTTLCRALARLEDDVPGLEAFAVQTARTADGGQDLTVYVSRTAHEAAVREAIGRLEGFEVIDLGEGGTSLEPAGRAAEGNHPLAS